VSNETSGADRSEELKKANKPQIESLKLHRFFRGKMETVLRCPVRDFDDFSYWYSPGVAAPCRKIEQDPELVYEYTSKWNTIAVISDGSRVLGLGDIGPKAGLPVMEGKALLFKYLGGVDCVPITLDTHDADEIIRTVLLLQPSFGGINLEDLAQPKCFRILETLRKQAEIPVWHDDQQGTATVTLAGLVNALEVVGKRIEDVCITFVGSGAANISCSRLIFARGADPARCRVVDSKGILGRPRANGSSAWRPAPWFLPVPIPSPRFGPGKPRLPAPRWLLRGEAIFPTRSTIRSASRVSFAEFWMSGPRRLQTLCVSPRPMHWLQPWAGT